MKTISKQINTEIYLCDVCGTEYQLASMAQFCENRHKQQNCQHKNVYYTLGYSAGRLVERKCRDCFKNVDHRGLDDVNSVLEKQLNYHSEFAEKLFNLIERYKREDN